MKTYFLLGSERISRITLKISKTVEFRGSAEVLHVCEIKKCNYIPYHISRQVGGKECIHALPYLGSICRGPQGSGRQSGNLKVCIMDLVCSCVLRLLLDNHDGLCSRRILQYQGD